MFVFDSIVVVRNPGWTLSPANLPPRSSANAANAPPCVAAVVETTVIDIEFADQLILVGLGNSDAEVFRHAGTGFPPQSAIAAFTGSRSSPSTNSRQEQQTILQQCEPAQGR